MSTEHAAMVAQARGVFPGATVVLEITREQWVEGIKAFLKAELAHLPPEPRLVEAISVVYDLAQLPDLEVPRAWPAALADEWGNVLITKRIEREERTA